MSSVKLWVGWVAVVWVLLVAGCGSSVIRLEQAGPGARAQVPSGLYELTIDTNDAGPVTVVMAIGAGKDGPTSFGGNSRPDAAGELIGGFKGFVAESMGGFDDGVLVRWEGSVQQDQSITGVLRTPMGNFRTEGSSAMQPMVLKRRGQTLGTASLRPIAPEEIGRPPLPEFKAVANDIAGVLKDRLFDPELLSTPECRDFLARIERLPTQARDQGEFLFGFYVSARSLPFSHVGLVRLAGEESALAQTGVGPEQAPTLTMDGRVATLRIPSFAVPSEVIERAMREVVERSPEALIIDLRDNQGGTFSSAVVASYLLETPKEMGALVSSKGRELARSGRWSELPTCSPSDPPEEVLGTAFSKGGVRGITRPAQTVYKNPVVVLTSRRTASAAEPLVHVLKTSRRATLIGERTAGAMLSSSQVPLSHGWTMMIPTLDYFTPEGGRLEGKGVAPDVYASPENAPAVAREHLPGAMTRR